MPPEKYKIHSEHDFQSSYKLVQILRGGQNTYSGETLKQEVWGTQRSRSYRVLYIYNTQITANARFR